MTTPPAWEAWAPPLDPPNAGKLPYAVAEAIAAEWWAAEPHLCAALQWEEYAARLPPGLAITSVTTGAQSVVYGQATAGGELGMALGRASWHRSMLGSLHSVPLRPAHALPDDYDPHWWEVEGA